MTEESYEGETLEEHDASFDPEEEWTTVRTFVWRGWKEHVIDKEPEFSDWLLTDQDGGIWTQAEPEDCDLEQRHVPRGHPGAAPGWYYCVRCGAQGVSLEPVDARLDPT